MQVLALGLSLIGLLMTPTAVTAAPTPLPSPAHAPTAAPHHQRTITVFAHRGASGHRPEHTLAAYELAIAQGADVIEPDLVSTKDGVLVARHENEISGTTDVADHPEFADRHTTKTIDGRRVTGWFTEDFTLAELKTLRATERLPEVRPQNTVYDGQFEIPTFDEVVDLAREASRRGRRVSVAPETKHPTYFASIGLDLNRPLLTSLRRVGWDRRNAPVAVQSFEVTNLRQLARRSRVPLVQLVASSGAPYDLAVSGDETTYADLVTPEGLRGVARYARWLGAEKTVIVDRGPGGTLGSDTGVAREAHRAGLKVVVYTIRDENQFLPTDLRRGDDPAARGDVESELFAHFAAGVDGVFADYPDTAVAARQAWNRRHR